MLSRVFNAVSKLLGNPAFWCGVIAALTLSALLNVVTRDRFDPGLLYTDFLQNYLQVVTQAVTVVGVVMMAQSHNDLHDKVDSLHQKID